MKLIKVASKSKWFAHPIVLFSSVENEQYDKSTQFCRIKGCSGAGCPPPTNNFRKTQVTPTNYISSEREFIGESKSFKISGKYFDFAIF